jgi:Flp pilus assembly pilin Flp
MSGALQPDYKALSIESNALTKTRKGGNQKMNYINKLIVRVRESKKGQTMTEYVLIIAAIAVAGYVAYQGLEGGINTIISNVTTTLKAA